MAEHDTKTELSKEVLAPAAEIREDLVATAVKFLQNEKVRQSPLGQKKAFLQRKGLTAEEIELAVSRAGVQDLGPVASAGTQQLGYVQKSEQSLVPVPVPPRAVEVSGWVRAKEVVVMVSMVMGVSYAAHRLYKEVIQPWLFGTKTDGKKLAALEKMITESTAKLNAIEETLGKQQEKLQMLSHDINSKTYGESLASTQSMSGVSDLKAELASIKGLLLNRRNFPPLPATTPALPAWQLASSSGDAGENSNQKTTPSETIQTTPTVTLSSSPTPGSPVQLDTGSDYRVNTEDALSKNSKNTDSVSKDSQGDFQAEVTEQVVVKDIHSETDADDVDKEKMTMEMKEGVDEEDSGANYAEGDADVANEESDQSLD